MSQMPVPNRMTRFMHHVPQGQAVRFSGHDHHGACRSCIPALAMLFTCDGSLKKSLLSLSEIDRLKSEMYMVTPLTARMIGYQT